MMTLIIGGSGSGKSAFAEDLLCERYPHDRKIYIATMECCDADARRRVEKHQNMRAGKGFLTVECPRDVGEISASGDVALLECLSNLVANEMFVQKNEEFFVVEQEKVVAKILSDLQQLKRKYHSLYVVSNNVFEDGTLQEGDMKLYGSALGYLHQELAKQADEVIEVVVGLPVFLKG